MILSREQILRGQPLRTERVPVPEWGPGAKVIVREMTGAEFDAYVEEESIGEGKARHLNPDNLRARFAVRVIVDEQGNRLLTSDDIKTLGDTGAGALWRIWEVGNRLNSLGDEAVKKLAGNSEAGPGDSTLSA